MTVYHRVVSSLLIASLCLNCFASAEWTVNATYQYLLGINDTIIETYVRLKIIAIVSIKSLLIHQIKGDSNNLPAIFSVAHAPGATGIRKISTPWPIIVGQSVLSVALFWIGDKPVYKKIILETVWFGFKYCLSMTRAIGGTAFLIIYITHSGTFPSIGIILIYDGFINSSYPFGQYREEHSLSLLQNIDGSTSSHPPENPTNNNGSHPLTPTKIVYRNLCRVAHLVSGVSIGLYIVAGALQITRKEFNIAQGCPNGTLFKLVELCSHPSPYLYSILTDDDASQISFWFLVV